MGFARRRGRRRRAARRESSCSGAAAARARELGVERRRLADAHATPRPGPWRGAAMSRCPLARPAATTPQQMRATDALGDRGARHPVARPDGAGRRSAWRELVGRGGADRRRSRIVVRQGQQRRRRPGGGAAAARGRPRGRRAVASAPLEELQRRRRGEPASGCPATRPQPFDAGCAGRRRGAIVDALLGTGFAGEPREPRRRARSRRSTRTTRPVVACDVPSGVDAVDRRGRWAMRCAPTLTATFHGAKVGLHVEPGQEPRRAS